MIKGVIFDLDGVLVDAKEVHYEALNLALKKVNCSEYVIGREEHLTIYDGLPTKQKLDLLTENKGLSRALHPQIWRSKQDETINAIKNVMKPDNRMAEVLYKLKEDGLKVYVATNSIRESLKLMLVRKGLMEYIDYYLSNDDVNNPKPNSEIYLRCMIHMGLNPKECMIVEDSPYGRQAALESGGWLCPVDSPQDVTYEYLKNKMNEINNREFIIPKWQGKKMNVLIPMAGAGSRFENAGYTNPKPLIDVNGKPMIQVVTENLNIEAHHIYLVQKSHYEKYNLQHTLNLISPGCSIIQIDGITEGAACSTLLAKNLINNDEPLLMANSDQFVDWDSNEFMYSMIADNVDAGMLTFKATEDKWSFAKLDNDGYVVEVAEKKPISDIATVGIYYWAKGSDYVKYAEQMIEKNIRTNNEFYVCPVFNEAIEDGKKIKTFDVPKMWGLGTPEDLENYLDNYDK